MRPERGVMSGLSGSFNLRRVSTLALAALVSAALLVTGIVPAASAAPVSLTVTVRTPAGVAITTGKVTAVSLADATYGAEVAGVYSAGRYSFTTLDSTTPYAIRVDTNKTVPNSNYTQYWGGASDLAGAKPWTSAVDSTLDFKLLGGTYSGKVLSPKGVGLPNVDVHLFKWDGVRWSLVKTVVSAATGSYSFPYLEPGSYTTEFDASRVQKAYISVFAGGAAVYGNETVPHSIDKAAKAYVTFGKPAVVNQKMTVGGTLSGQALKESQPYSTHLRVAAMAIFGTAPNQTSSTMPMVPLRLNTPLKFKLTGLPTGYYSLSAGGPDQLGGYTDPFTDPAVKATDQRVYYVKAGTNVTGALVDLDPTWQSDVKFLRGSFAPSGAVTGGTVTIGRATDFEAGQILPITAAGKFEQELPAGLYRYEARPTGSNPLKPTYGEILFPATGEQSIVIPAAAEESMGFASGPTVSPVSGSVGTTFTASATSNHPTTSVVTYQWLRDGIPIFGARSASFTAGGGELGKALTVRVGITDLEAFDNVSRTVSLGTVTQGAAITNITAPSVVAPATVKVGTVLRADPGTWSETPVSLSYQWMLNGGPIPNATKPTFTPIAAHGGQDIGLSVTAARTGHASVTYTPEYTEDHYVSVASLPAPVLTIAPKVTTTVLTGGRIRYSVSSGTWSPKPLYVTWDWYLDGDLQPSSPSPQITLDPQYDDMTAVLTVEVRAAREGGQSGTTLLVARKSTLPPIADVSPTVVHNVGEDPLTQGSPIRSGESVSVQEGYWIYADPMWIREVTPLSHSYTWYRGESPRVKIVGATASSYRFTDADNGLPISVNVLTTSPGMVPATTVIPAGTGYLDDALLDVAATVSLDSAVTPLVPVVATVSDSFSAFTPVTVRYQWMTCKPASSACDTGSAGNYSPIAAATARSYVPPASLAGTYLGVRVTVGKIGFQAVQFFTSASVGPASVISAAPPTISGTAFVGGKLLAVAGPKDIPGTTSTFTWKSETLTLGTGPAYVVKAEQYNQPIHVVETIKKTGYGTLVMVSDEVEVEAGVEAVASAPKITTVGLTSTIAATFVPAGTADYQWFLGDEAVGGSAPSYTRPALDKRPVTVAVTYDTEEPAYGAGPFQATYLAVRGVLTGTALPTITGSRLGDVLHANAPVFAYPSDEGTEKVTYQWYVGGIAITGATTASYTPPSAASVGKKYTVRVTSTTQNYAVASVLSPAVTLLAGLNPSGTPTVDVAGGVVKPGAVLTANTSSFTLPGQSFSYQWQANTGAGWVSIATATAKTYKVLPTQVGASLRVIVTGKRLGYATSTGTSVGATVLTSGDLPLLSAPSLVGTGVAGSTLSVTAPTFGVTGVTLSYRWLRNGVLMPGATATSFVTSTGQINDSIAVEVTAKAPGYLPWVSLLDARVITAP